MLRRAWLLVATLLLVLLSIIATALIAWPVLLLVLLADLLWWPVAQLRRRQASPPPRDVSGASIVTVSWNGKHFLETLLPSLRRVIDEDGGDHEVIVVDNGSEDGTVEWLAEVHPWVRVVALPENRFFVRGNKAGVEAATRDVLVFLNNDMEVRPGFLTPLLEGLRDPSVFGVTAEVFFRDEHKRREETGRTRGEIRHGWLKLAHVEPSHDERELSYVPAFWAGGGSAAFDRRMYLALDGFDTLYDPFYMEDTGLSYQAWRRGWRILFTARASVLHEHRGTSRKVFGDDYIDNVIRRNQHLFIWRNITDPRMISAVLGMAPLTGILRARRPGRTLASGIAFELKAFLRAVCRLPQALTKRCASREHYRMTDRDVMNSANSIAEYRARFGADLGALPVPAAGGRRILVLSARLPRLGHDGSWVLFRRLEFMARRHRVTLFAFIDDVSEISAITPLRKFGIEVVTKLRRRNPQPGNLHHAVPHRLWRDYSASEMRAAVRRMLEGTDHDLVQVEYVEMAHLVANEPRVAPRIYVCHESMAVAAVRESSGMFRELQAHRYEQKLLRSFDRVAALSDADACALRPAAADADVVPSGIDVESWRVEGVSAEDSTIAFVGYYKHSPNVDAAHWLVQEILPRVREKIPGARVRLIGREAPPSVMELAEDDAVEYAGFVPDLAEALAQATVVAMPLRSGGGLRGKVLEAWAVGRAVVATSVACEGLDVRDGEHALVADDAEGFAAQLVACLQDRKLRQRLELGGGQLVRERYSVQTAVAKFDSIYDDLLGRKS